MNEILKRKQRLQKRKKVKRKCTEKIRLQNFLLQKYTRGKSFAGEREKGNVIQQKCKKCESHTHTYTHNI